MKRVLTNVICIFCLGSTPTFASSFLELACENDETKSYCSVLLQGFITGYKMGYHNGTFNATAAEGERGPELCVPPGLTSGDIYEDMYPYIVKDIEFLDFSLFVAALKAYPCEASGSKNSDKTGG